LSFSDAIESMKMRDHHIPSALLTIAFGFGMLIASQLFIASRPPSNPTAHIQLAILPL